MFGCQNATVSLYFPIAKVEGRARKEEDNAVVDVAFLGVNISQMLGFDRLSLVLTPRNRQSDTAS